MKTYFFTFLLFYFFTINSYSQQTQFNRTYLFSNNSASTSIYSINTGYVGMGAYWYNFKQFIMINKYDLYGNITDTFYYGDTIHHWYHGAENNLIKVENNGYAISGHKVINSPREQEYILIRLSPNLDTTWVRSYIQDTVESSAYATVYCTDGGFAIAGWSKRDAETGEVLTKTKAFLLRTDSQGNYLWHKTYGTTDYSDSFYKIVQTPDGGFLCGGGTKSYSSSHNNDWYIVKIDANGNEEWHRRYGSQFYSDYRVSNILKTTDTNYVITGGTRINNEEVSPTVIVLNQNFQLTKIKSFPNSSFDSSLGQIKEIEGGYIGIGRDRINNALVAQTTLTKFDTDFNEVWRRKYTVGDTTSTDNYILSLDTCSDGGYVLGGWAGGFTGGQRLALIKTDEYGCDGTDWWPCTGVNIQEYAHSERFKLYPNPAREQLTISIPAKAGISIPTVKIFDLTGKLVKQIVRLSGDKVSRGTVFSVDISDLEKGLYVVKVGQKTKKLVVE